MKKTKYIRTKEDEIIIFSEIQKHSDFKCFYPVSAGFINRKTLECYGESISLRMKSGEGDTDLARIQFGGMG